MNAINYTAQRSRQELREDFLFGFAWTAGLDIPTATSAWAIASEPLTTEDRQAYEIQGSVAGMRWGHSWRETQAFGQRQRVVV